MAMTPKQALGNKPDALKKRVAQIELQIDAKLAKEYNGRNSVSVQLGYDEDNWVLDQLKKKYIKAGWKVGYEKRAGYSDYRDSSPGYTMFSLSAETSIEEE
jgi:hypothetical protein